MRAPAAAEPSAKRHANLIRGDVLAVPRTLPAEAAHCCVTGPPHFALRDYGLPPQVWGGVRPPRPGWSRPSRPRPDRGRDGIPRKLWEAD